MSRAVTSAGPPGREWNDHLDQMIWKRGSRRGSEYRSECNNQRQDMFHRSIPNVRGNQSDSSGT
jgi:hypothetical protein